MFVINLPEAVERRTFIEAQLRALGMTYEIFPATRGSALTADDWLAHADVRAFARYEGRSMLPGELGCALSHIGIYRQVLDRALPMALILEDDACLNPNVPRVAEALERCVSASEARAILLTWASVVGPVQRGKLWAGYQLTAAKSAVCTHGYVITRAAAERLIAALYPVRHPADCWTWMRRHGVLRIDAVVPPCITADLSLATQIPGTVNHDPMRSSLIRRSWRRVCRAWWRIGDWTVAACHRLVGPV